MWIFWSAFTPERFKARRRARTGSHPSDVPESLASAKLSADDAAALRALRRDKEQGSQGR